MKTVFRIYSFYMQNAKSHMEIIAGRNSVGGLDKAARDDALSICIHKNNDVMSFADYEDPTGSRLSSIVGDGDSVSTARSVSDNQSDDSHDSVSRTRSASIHP